jgi:hypothetical protein
MPALPPGKEPWSSLNRGCLVPRGMLGAIKFNSIQFNKFHQIHYKSKRPIGYKISRSALSQTLMDKDTTHNVTIIIRAGNKISLIYGYLIYLFI